MKKSTYIKIAITLYAIVLFGLNSQAQGFKKLDEAPHDIAYYRETRVTTPLVKVVYGRPNSKNDQIFGEKIPFGEVWRTGANEATEVKLYKDMLFGDKLVSAGTYVLVTIPGEKEWEIILSSNLDVWGAYQYEPTADVARIKVPVSKAENLESFSIGFKKTENNLLMVLGWGSTRVKVPLGFEEPTYFAKL